MTDAETPTIGEGAKGAGVNMQTLHYYERRGLLTAPPRAHTGHRRYPFDAVKHVRSIKQARALGFRLDEKGRPPGVARPGGAPNGDAYSCSAERSERLENGEERHQRHRGNEQRAKHDRHTVIENLL